MATITKELVKGLMETVRNLYLADDIPWVIGYSGGKDSTATLQLLVILPVYRYLLCEWSFFYL